MNLRLRSNPSPVSNRFLHQFVEQTIAETGLKCVDHLVQAVGLAPLAVRTGKFKGLDGHALVETYALLQQALRLYYRRGARGMLLRIGDNLWGRILHQADIIEKGKLHILRSLPYSLRRRRILEQVASHFGGDQGSTSVHLLDVDLLLVDRTSATTYGQHSNQPICYVSLGMIQAALRWATGREEDVEEIACRAAGAQACEFKVRTGGM